jgi:aryl-alcohol dehydrogenase-like predicted oxidoreductase
MQYRTIGKTGLRVSEIGFGCGNNAVLMVKAPHEDQVKAVRHALDMGINFFDTAFAYGLGRSEENLGRILHELGAEPVVSTKIRLEADAVADLRAATVRAVEGGLSRLGRDRVDFVQLHTRVTLDRGMGKRFSLTPKDVLGPNGVIDGFKSMRDRGKVGFFGFSGLGDAKALHELVDSGEFHGFQCYYNLLNPSAGQPSQPRLVPWIMVESSIALRPRNGRLRYTSVGGRCADFGSERRRSGSGQTLSPGSDYPVDLQRAEKIKAALGVDGKDLTQAAIRFGLMNEKVSTVLVGFSNLTHIDDAVACSGAPPLSDEQTAKINTLWETDFSLSNS